MKKMTVTELNALTDYVVESVLNAKRENAKKSVSTISEKELAERLEECEKLVANHKAAEEAYNEAKQKLNDFAECLSEKNCEGRYVYVEPYYTHRAEIREMTDEQLFRNTKLEPFKLRKDVERKLVLKNLGSEVDVEKFVQELVASY